MIVISRLLFWRNNQGSRPVALPLICFKYLNEALKPVRKILQVGPNWCVIGSIVPRGFPSSNSGFILFLRNQLFDGTYNTDKHIHLLSTSTNLFLLRLYQVRNDDHFIRCVIENNDASFIYVKHFLWVKSRKRLTFLFGEQFHFYQKYGLWPS
jgi:hypothetical protein